MKLLLDTHTLHWYANGSPQILVKVTELRKDPTSILCLGRGSVWEIAKNGRP